MLMIRRLWRQERGRTADPWQGQELRDVRKGSPRRKGREANGRTRQADGLTGYHLLASAQKVSLLKLGELGENKCDLRSFCKATTMMLPSPWVT